MPQDVYQTAKVSKLLLAINKGKGALYKGKTLDEIQFSDNVDSDESDSEPDLNPIQKISRRNDATDKLGKGAGRTDCVNIANTNNLVGTSSDNPVNIDENNTLQDTFSEDEDSPTTVLGSVPLLYNSYLYYEREKCIIFSLEFEHAFKSISKI